MRLDRGLAAAASAGSGGRWRWPAAAAGGRPAAAALVQPAAMHYRQAHRSNIGKTLQLF